MSVSHFTDTMGTSVITPSAFNHLGECNQNADPIVETQLGETLQILPSGLREMEVYITCESGATYKGSATVDVDDETPMIGAVCDLERW